MAWAAPPPPRQAAAELTLRAQELMARGSYAEASEKLVASKAIRATAQTVLLLAQCYERMGRLVAAVAEYRAAGSAARSEGQTHRAVAGDEGVIRLTPRLAHVTIAAPEIAIPGLEVRRDGELLADKDFGVATLMDPGSHELVATAPERKPWSLVVQIAAGESPTFRVPPLDPEDEPEVQAGPPKNPVIAAVSKPTAAKPVEDSSGFLPLPVLFYGPETELGFGAFGLYYFHVGNVKTTRASSIQGSITGTTKGQVLSDLGLDLWLAKDAFHIEPTVYLRHFPDAYYGVGNETALASGEGFTERGYIGYLNAQVRVVSRLYAGLRFRADLRDIRDRQPGKLLETENIHGRDGGFTSGGGPAITYDSRDNTYAPARGAYLDFAFGYHPRELGSDFRFGQARTDLRKYFPIGNDVLALQLVGEVVSGETPFYLLPRIGGGANLRGIPFGRYRDNLMLEAQAEYRFPIFWHFGGVGFLGAGKVAHAAGDLDFRALRVAGGTGLRFAVVPSERINIRLDVAYAAEGINYYLALGEAF
ncbi:MAG: hypothetical protein JWM74_6043 [Myxococcaceae bacterium]|nr:hypothetical protein [Myxococcaceae bacterium]